MTIMGKLNTDDNSTGRIGNVVVYRYNDMRIVRTISGFTTEALRTSPQYENCRKAASEFGHVSSACKQIRTALYGILPVRNNLAVVNSFTKKMRSVLDCDTTNQKGQRQLANALATEEGRELLKGYEFNPDTKIAFEYAIADDDSGITINTNGIIFPKAGKRIGFRTHRLAFDFETGASELASGEWVLGAKDSLPNDLVLDLPGLTDGSGVVWRLLEVEFYDGKDKPMIGDGGKRVLVVSLA
jgi:hypothetical protein